MYMNFLYVENSYVYKLSIFLNSKFLHTRTTVQSTMNGTDDIDIEWALWEPDEIALILKSEINDKIV